MFMEGLVSVIIPVYNSSKFIKETILSAVNQSYKKIEVVLVDDCSSDNSVEIIERLQTQFKNIFLYKNKKNSGAGVSRNAAIGYAKGQYIAFLDSDDVWDKEKIKKQLNDLKMEGGSFSYTAIEMIDQDGVIKKKKRKIKRKVSYRFLLKNTVIPTSTVVIDRNVVGDFRMSHRRGGQDYATWLEIIKISGFAYGIDEPLCKYRVGRKDSLAGNKWKSIKQVWSIQREDQHIGRIRVMFNVACFIFNALKKYLL